MIKTYTKTFNNKFYMNNYLNKMKENKKIDILFTALSFECGGWTIYYQYKK